MASIAGWERCKSPRLRDNARRDLSFRGSRIIGQAIESKETPTMPTIDRSAVIASAHEIEDQLRSQVLREIERRGLTPAELAEALGTLPENAELLLEREAWSLELGLRMAKSLNLKVEVQARAAD